MTFKSINWFVFGIGIAYFIGAIFQWRKGPTLSLIYCAYGFSSMLMSTMKG